jgi:DNA-binding response OmpR family regulator
LHRLILVEDDAVCGRAVQELFSCHGFEVTWMTEGRTLSDVFRRTRPHLVVLDLMLPDADGAELCSRLRQHSDVPILILSGRSTTLDKVTLFRLGADDYVTKPYEPAELLVRVEALLRRPDLGQTESVLRAGCLTLDPTGYRVICDGNDLKLTRIEFELLRRLMAARGQTTSRDTLLDEIWGRDYSGSLKTLDTHVSSLRRKISQAKPGWKPLRAVRGNGYRFVV